MTNDAHATLRPVDAGEREEFDARFQDYLRELSHFSGVRPNRKGRFDYPTLDLYWEEAERMPFFIECAGERAGLLMLRELPRHESHLRRPSLQVAEIYVFPTHRRRGLARDTMRLAAAMAAERHIPLTWSAYMNNGPANAAYRALVEEFNAKEGAWQAGYFRGIDGIGHARFYYQMTPAESRTGESGG